MPDLETVTLEGVEILSVGGPFKGIGSPPEGDFYTEADLRAMADAAIALGEELDPPAKIGHSDAQALAFNSELAPVTPGEMPRVGTLSNQRVSDDGQKLLCDIADVPKKFAELVKAKAYKKRSVELAQITSQKTGEVYDWVVTGLAWLGAKMPAVRTLDDVAALYEGDGVETKRIHYAEGAVVWDPDTSFQALRDNVAEALNGPATGGMNEPRFWVQDVDVVGSRALVGDYYHESYTDAWVIPFSRAADGSISISPSSDWTKAEQAWVETAKEFEQEVASGFARRHADTQREMKFSDEQRRKFAEATGLDADKVTDEMLGAAGIVAESDPAPPDPDPDPDPDPKPDDDAARSLEEAVAKATSAEERSKKLEEQLRVSGRKSFVDEALQSGKIAPGQRATLEALYDANQDAARAFVEEAPVNEELVKEFGSEETSSEDEQEAENRAYIEDAAQRLGIPKEHVI